MKAVRQVGMCELAFWNYLFSCDSCFYLF